ncbi:MAG: peptidylprolyl isomerase [Acidobacteria bacterium]|nr:peptidylprolyl isomerase [Acidobacteriota bacterium]
MIVRAFVATGIAVVTIGVAAYAPQPRRVVARPSPSEAAAILAAEDTRAERDEELRILLDGAQLSNPADQTLAVRALGRLERRDVIPKLLVALSASAPRVRGESANALAQALNGSPLSTSAPHEQVRGVMEALLHAAAKETNGPALAAFARSLARLPYTTHEQVRSAEGFIAGLVDQKAARDTVVLVGAARGLEALARRNPTLTSFEEKTLGALRRLARRTQYTFPPDVRRNAAAALLAARAFDDSTLRSVTEDSDEQVRRFGVLALAGAGSPLEPVESTRRLRTALADTAATVRYEAVRAWSRRIAPTEGCQALLDARWDPVLYDTLAVIDALGDVCKGDDDVTNAVAYHARTPPTVGSWHSESHALVALAKRSPERAALALPSHAVHPLWQVRMYAARAAALLKDDATLERLVYDAHDNVREAALGPFHVLRPADSERALIAALGRPDLQLVRTAAQLLDGTPANQYILKALSDALRRVTSAYGEMSRDTRLELIARLRQLGGPPQADDLIPLVSDVDPVVASTAADAIRVWSGTRPATPALAHRIAGAAALGGDTTLTVTLGSGRKFALMLLIDEAPHAAAIFRLLAGAGKYDGLTFHRVVPNFVIQGGSPGANEYMPRTEAFMRDEVGLTMHERGTVGISTRGRDTGDGQIFINLVDNAPLDHEYTVFGRVPAADMAVVESILEGDTITRIALEEKR